MPLLHDAVLCNAIAHVRELLEFDCNVNEFSHPTGRVTPLHLAAQFGHAGIVEVLLEYGADATLKDEYGDTPMDDAIANKQKNVIELLKKGAK